MTTCPACHSEEITFLGLAPKGSNQAPSLLWSQSTLTFIGKELAKVYRIPSVIGEITGASLGYVLNYYLQKHSGFLTVQNEKSYICNDCNLTFQIN
ncbi:hypothetical protein [Acinetobacter sp. AL9]|uniref:hypothetical protein n=1 Tax=Acinetobacter sp. AL9 TaxID=3273234 RepID=UPI0035560B65